MQLRLLNTPGTLAAAAPLTEKSCLFGRESLSHLTSHVFSVTHNCLAACERAVPSVSYLKRQERSKRNDTFCREELGIEDTAERPQLSSRVRTRGSGKKEGVKRRGLWSETQVSQPIPSDLLRGCIAASRTRRGFLPFLAWVPAASKMRHKMMDTGQEVQTSMLRCEMRCSSRTAGSQQSTREFGNQPLVEMLEAEKGPASWELLWMLHELGAQRYGRWITVNVLAHIQFDSTRPASNGVREQC